MPTGLVLNEILTNAYKHAFQTETGILRITLSQTDGDGLAGLAQGDAQDSGLPSLEGVLVGVGQDFIEDETGRHGLFDGHADGVEAAVEVQPGRFLGMAEKAGEQVADVVVKAYAGQAGGAVELLVDKRHRGDAVAAFPETLEGGGSHGRAPPGDRAARR